MASITNSEKSAFDVEDNKKLAIFIGEWLKLIAAEKEKKKTTEVQWGTQESLNKAVWVLGLWQVMLIILFACVGGTELIPTVTDDYFGIASPTPGTVTQGYNMFIGIEIMMFIGFGYLMTFLKWYGIGAVGFTMLITAMGFQWYLFTNHFFYSLYHTVSLDGDWGNVPINIYSLMDCLFGVSAVLISFGALIGKVSPLQLVVLTIIELAMHACNYRVLMYGVLHVKDIGGTYVDHMFGAYFGLAVSWVLGRPKSEPEFGYVNDFFSFIGTLFLWIYWPSFVAGAAEADSAQQERGLCNTIVALSGSTIAAFLVSSFWSHNGRFRPVDIQNATLAGGVAIGCVANLQFSAFSALCVGLAAGTVAALGFNYIQPKLEATIGLHDTCGVHNLHAMPSVIGGLTSVIIAGYAQSDGRTTNTDIYGSNRRDQWWRQWVGILLCVGFAISTGLITGFVLKALETEKPDDHKEYHDEPYWEVADDYGHSLYGELATVMKAATAKAGVTGLVDAAALDKEVSEWSSHSGRRQRMAPPSTSTAAALDTASLHGPRRGGAATPASATPPPAAAAAAPTDKGYQQVATAEVEMSKV